jgi:hypothetical protein
MLKKYVIIALETCFGPNRRVPYVTRKWAEIGSKVRAKTEIYSYELNL